MRYFLGIPGCLIVASPIPDVKYYKRINNLYYKYPARWTVQEFKDNCERRECTFDDKRNDIDITKYENIKVLASNSEINQKLIQNLINF